VRTAFIRFLVLLICMAAMLPLSTPQSTMAQDEGEILQCRCDSDQATMILEFPAGGGRVSGAYTSSMVAEDVSLLFAEDGSSDEYLEERTVNVSVELSGTYSPDDSPPFSLQLSGVGTVHIDNLDDQRFDRSYEAALEGTGTGLFNDDGSITLGLMWSEFALASVDAEEIPNTRWLDPPPPTLPRELTLSCRSGAPMALSVAPSCTITTIPDPIGPQDTTIQTKVTATGFQAPRADPVGVRGPDLGPVAISGQGMSTTLSWPVASLGPGFYTLSTWVYEESPPYYWAECATHFTIGDTPNNPPECQITGLNPSAPSVGDTSLEVTVQGRDADGDSLNYWFNLQGSMVASGVDVGPQYTFSIPGGLQPGTYAVMVSVDDGKHWNYCQRNLLVSAAPQPPGAPAPAIPPAAPVKKGPPKAPQPPTTPPQPPAPPPVPPPTEGCGPVQVIYLDDLGVGMNQTEIDAFVEKALAQGGPDLSLVLSHRQALIDRFGQQGFVQIDGLLQDLGNIAETCPFVLIVGDPDVVPFGTVPNPTTDGDVLFTDDVYGDNDHDVLGLPDIPVARIPDGRSLALLLTQLSPSTVPEGGDFTLANSKRPHADGVATQVFGADRALLWSLPTEHEEVDASQVGVRYSYFMLHGASWDTTAWWGEEEVYPEAFTVAEASTEGIVLSGACYGGYTFGRGPDNSITLSFLESGARAFVGSTGITYSPMWTSGPNPTGPMRHDALFHEAFLSAVSGGQAPLAAFMEAKQEMADACRLGDSTPAELKMLHEFLYFGKP
jgi:hypothetical protein